MKKNSKLASEKNKKSNRRKLIDSMTKRIF